MLVFFLQPIAFGSWLPRIPDVQQALGLGPAGLAMVLLGLPAGTLLTLPFAGPLVGRIGARAAIIFGFMLYAIAVSLPGLATNPVLLFVALMLCGSTISFVELGLNVEADKVEKATGRLIMNKAHGFWSLGIMTGSIIGSALAAAGVEARWAILDVAAVTLVVGPLVGRLVPDYGPDSAASVPGVKPPVGFRLPDWALLGICLFVFGVTMTEGAMADWSAVFLRDVLGVGSEAGIGYAVFALFVAAGRFWGDWAKSRLGAVVLARASVVFAIVGIGVLTLAPSLPFALFGLAIVGLGASVGFPLAVTAAADLDPARSSTSVATLSFIALLGFLVGPPLIGFIGQHVDLRFGIAALLPILLVSLALSGRLTRKAAEPHLLAQGEA
ncbi:MFS transporter [Devosia sp. CN2-171]|uniref:MFS transporter n=1 Tax=Devosia sp. CN2-171 TaxID=3400909 RepID=UPI003BF8602B